MAPLNQRRIKAADLNRFVRLEQRSETVDGQGGVVTVWQTVTACEAIPACIISLRGYEHWLAQQIYPGVTYDVYIRYRSNVDTTMRLVLGSRILGIRAVLIPDHAPIFLRLRCEELYAQ